MTRRFAAERRALQRSKGATGVRGHSAILTPPATGRDQQSNSPLRLSRDIRLSRHKTRRRHCQLLWANGEAVYDESGEKKLHLEASAISAIQKQESRHARANLTDFTATALERIHPQVPLDITHSFLLQYTRWLCGWTDSLTTPHWSRCHRLSSSCPSLWGRKVECCL